MPVLLAYPMVAMGLIGSLLLGSLGLSNLTGKWADVDIEYHNEGNGCVEIFIKDGQETFIAGVNTNTRFEDAWDYMAFLDEKGERVNVLDINNGFGWAFDENNEQIGFDEWAERLNQEQLDLYDWVVDSEIIPKSDGELQYLARKMKLDQKVKGRWFKEAD